MNPVKNITIADAKTGFVIVERKFRWPSHANSSNLGSLTQSFFQFAREVDEGLIESVVFEGKEPHNSGKTSKQHQTMKMVCTRNEYETISIYYDTTNYVVDPTASNDLLLTIEQQFGRECGDLLSRLSARIASLVDSVEENSEEVEDIRSHFDFFKQHIDRIILAAFPPTPAIPPPPHGREGRKSDVTNGSKKSEESRRNENCKRSGSSRSGSSRSGSSRSGSRRSHSGNRLPDKI